MTNELNKLTMRERQIECEVCGFHPSLGFNGAVTFNANGECRSCGSEHPARLLAEARMLPGVRFPKPKEAQAMNVTQFATIAEVRAANRVIGDHFFDAPT